MMKLKSQAIALMCAAAVLISTTTAAQGVQTGTIRGTVTSTDQLTLPGATVTIESPALQGERFTTTEDNGGFLFRSLPPGDYTLTFAMDGMTTTQRRVSVPLGGVAEVDMTMGIAAITEVVEVVGDAASSLTTPTVGANYKHAEIDALATPRTLAGIASLAPGLTQNSPNTGPTEGQGQVVINGGLAYDSLFMINGVDVNDNIFGWAQNLFIEDAIAETQILTSGISAEYGRFSGGVVNAITKSGGNAFSGSYRLNLANDAWSTETPFESSRNVTRVSTVNPIHEATFGGPIVKNKLWFFLAGRYANNRRSNTLPFTGTQFETTDKNSRGELKLTSTVRPGHVLSGSVLGNPREQTNQANFTGGLATIDPFALSDKKRPNHLLVAGYNGVINQRWLAEAQYSHQQFETDAGGGTSTSIVDSPFLSFDFTRQYNAPYFDATDPDGRNNRQLTGSVSYFSGRHAIKSGYEWFRSNKVGGNSQSSTGYVFLTDYATNAAGAPVFDAGGRLMPLFVPGETQIFSYEAVRGAVLNLDSHSVYAQDHWAINPRLSADVGLRMEQVNSSATSSASAVNAFRIVPRLGLAFDPNANGSLVLHATYAHYSGRYSDALTGSNSPVGHPIEIDGVYEGPAGQGRGFAAGFNPANYNYDGIFASFPSANVFFDPDFSSPLTKEFSASAGTTLGRRGSAQATYVWRRASNLVEDFVDRSTGTTFIAQIGTMVSNRVYGNSDDAFREYQGLLFQSRYDLRPGWSLAGHWTVQLRNHGNYEGEAAQQILTSAIGDYPEIFTEERHYPSGRLSSFQRHKLDIWTIKQLDFGRAGSGSVSGLWRYNSGRVFSLRVANQGITAVQAAALAAAGYVDGPASQAIFYAPPGSEEFAGYGVVDASASYNVPVLGDLRPWLKVDLFNVFNNQKLISWNTTIRQDAATPRDALGLRSGYTPGPLFGQATGNGNYPVPFGGQTGGRTLRLALGFRF
jgi:hypothetical protein